MVSATSQFLTLPSQTHSGPDDNCLIEQPAGLNHRHHCQAVQTTVITVRVSIKAVIKLIFLSVLMVILLEETETTASPGGEWSGGLEEGQTCGPVSTSHWQAVLATTSPVKVTPRHHQHHQLSLSTLLAGLIPAIQINNYTLIHPHIHTGCFPIMRIYI